MKLGAFSISLNVKDIKKSKKFYENIGFKVFGGDITQNWLVMKNKSTIIGLFRKKFDNKLLKCNPEWDQEVSQLDSYTDIRDIEKSLKSHGIKLDSETDLDGNSTLFDQHV